MQNFDNKHTINSYLEDRLTFLFLIAGMTVFHIVKDNGNALSGQSVTCRKPQLYLTGIVIKCG